VLAVKRDTDRAGADGDGGGGEAMVTGGTTAMSRGSSLEPRPNTHAVPSILRPSRVSMVAIACAVALCAFNTVSHTVPG